MDAARFADSAFGRAAREPGNRWAFTYYLPAAIPRDLPLSGELVQAMSEADAALGRLQGLGQLIPETELLIGPYQRREALASSRIEGTQASLSDLLRAEADDTMHNADTLEVQRYLAATKLAFSLHASLPITQRLLLQVHETLLRGVRGAERRPGEFRASPVWVGSASATPETAPFVPPLPEHLPELLADWERFVNRDGHSYPPIIQAALMHYQFETIHPFLDGNGRVGRLLINLVLKERGRMELPLLYISSYLETHRSRYYAALQGVREKGDVETWLAFFLHAVHTQAVDAVERATRLLKVSQEYRQTAVTTRSRLPLLVEQILVNPLVTVRSVERGLQVSNQGARQLIQRAEALGWLVSQGAGPRGAEYWVAPEVMDILDAPMDPYL